MTKKKSHKGLLKRIRISSLGKVLFKRPNRSHLRSGKSAKRLMNLRRRMTAKAGDMNRLQLILGRRLKPAHYRSPAQRWLLKPSPKGWLSGDKPLHC